MDEGPQLSGMRVQLRSEWMHPWHMGPTRRINGHSKCSPNRFDGRAREELQRLNLSVPGTQPTPTLRGAPQREELLGDGIDSPSSASRGWSNATWYAI